MATPINGDPSVDTEAIELVEKLEKFLSQPNKIKNLDQKTLRKMKRVLGHSIVDIDFNLDQRNEQGRGGLKSSISHLKKKFDIREEPQKHPLNDSIEQISSDIFNVPLKVLELNENRCVLTASYPDDIDKVKRMVDMNTGSFLGTGNGYKFAIKLSEYAINKEPTGDSVICVGSVRVTHNPHEQ